MARRRVMVWLLSLGIAALLITIVAAVWGADLLIPLAESRASAALGRSVAISHLHVTPGRLLRITADDVVVGNPPNWHGDPFAKIPRVTLDVDAWAYIRSGQTVIPLLTMDQPLVAATETTTGEVNFWPGHADTAGSSVKIGVVRVDGGRIRVRLAQLKADFQADVATHGGGQESQLLIDANGSYDGQPISGHMVGGALLSLRDPSNPWPIDLRLQHGPTTVSVAGTLLDPVGMKGASLALQLSSPDLSSTDALTGIPLPKTPKLDLTGRLDFANQRVRLQDLNGRLGNTDLAGTIEVAGGKERPEIFADLTSRRVDLADFGGTSGAEQAKAEADDRLLPRTPTVLPKLRRADVHLKYRGQRIQGKSVLLDNLDAVLDVVDGQATLHPITAGVGRGSISGTVVLTPQDRVAHAKAEIALQHVDVLRLMAATQRRDGAGAISGTVSIDATGSSLAQMLGSGNGWLRLGMVGGDLSAVLVRLLGVQYGNALLSALGLPNRAPVECFLGDLPLQRGVLTLQTLVVDTGEAAVTGVGTIDLGQEKLDVQLRSESKHFSIGSLPAPLNVTGTLKHPSVAPGSESVTRGGAAAGLATTFPPLALLPTVQFGTGEDRRCDALLARAKRLPGGEGLPTPPNLQTTR
jgi:hypothetical protein